MDTVDFLEKLGTFSATIPPMASRLAGFFLVIQALLIVLQKKNDPHKAIWEDISGVLLAGLVVFLFPEFIKLADLAVTSACHVQGNPTSAVADYMRTSLYGEPEAAEEGAASGLSWFQTAALWVASSNVVGVAKTTSYMFADNVLKPLADIINVLCFPTYLFIRAACLKVAYLVAPLVLVLGAFQPFRALWKHWFMIYFALLTALPALVLANNFCEDCFNLYITCTNSPTMGFFMVALARFKIFQAVMDLCYRIFRV